MSDECDVFNDALKNLEKEAKTIRNLVDKNR